MSWRISLISFSVNELGAEDPVKGSREDLWGMVESPGGGKTVVWTEGCLGRVAICVCVSTLSHNIVQTRMPKRQRER